MEIKGRHLLLPQKAVHRRVRRPYTQRETRSYAVCSLLHGRGNCRGSVAGMWNGHKGQIGRHHTLSPGIGPVGESGFNE